MKQLIPLALAFGQLANVQADEFNNIQTDFDTPDIDFHNKDRGEMYLRVYQNTEGKSAVFEGNITTFSGPIGGTAFLANYVLADKSEHGGALFDYRVNPISGHHNVTEFSQAIAQDYLSTVIADVRAGGFGNFEIPQGISFAQTTWRTNFNMEQQFPGIAIGTLMQQDHLTKITTALNSDGNHAAIAGAAGSILFGKTLEDFTSISDYEILPVSDPHAQDFVSISDYVLHYNPLHVAQSGIPGDRNNDGTVDYKDGNVVMLNTPSFDLLGLAWLNIVDAEIFLSTPKPLELGYPYNLRWDDYRSWPLMKDFRRQLVEGGEYDFTQFAAAHGIGQEKDFWGKTESLLHDPEAVIRNIVYDFDRTVVGTTGDDFIGSGAGADYLDGGQGNDVLRGGRNADVLMGGEGDDKLYGERGNDILIGGPGADLLDGGSDEDTVVYTNSPAGVNLNFVTQTAQDGWGTTDTFTNVENAILTPFDDVVTVDTKTIHTLEGGAGNDQLSIKNDVSPYPGLPTGLEPYHIVDSRLAVREGKNNAVGFEIFDTTNSVNGNFIIHKVGGHQFNGPTTFGGAFTILNFAEYPEALEFTIEPSTFTFPMKAKGTIRTAQGNIDSFNTHVSIVGTTNGDTYFLPQVIYQAVSTPSQVPLLSGPGNDKFYSANYDSPVVYGGGDDEVNVMSPPATPGSPHYTLLFRMPPDVTDADITFELLNYHAITIFAPNDAYAADLKLHINHYGSITYKNGLVYGLGADGYYGADERQLGYFYGDTGYREVWIKPESPVSLTPPQYSIKSLPTTVPQTHKIEGTWGHDVIDISAKPFYSAVNGFSGDDIITGNDQANVLEGGDGDDIIKGMGGDDTIIGGAGYDTALLRGKSSDYIVTGGSEVAFTMTGPDGSDTFFGIEKVVFEEGGFYEVSSLFGREAQLIKLLSDNANASQVASALPGNSFAIAANRILNDSTYTSRFLEAYQAFKISNPGTTNYVFQKLFDQANHVSTLIQGSSQPSVLAFAHKIANGLKLDFANNSGYPMLISPEAGEAGALTNPLDFKRDNVSAVIMPGDSYAYTFPTTNLAARFARAQVKVLPEVLISEIIRSATNNFAVPRLAFPNALTRNPDGSVSLKPPANESDRFYVPDIRGGDIDGQVIVEFSGQNCALWITKNGNVQLWQNRDDAMRPMIFNRNELTNLFTQALIIPANTNLPSSFKIFLSKPNVDGRGPADTSYERVLP